MKIIIVSYTETINSNNCILIITVYYITSLLLIINLFTITQFLFLLADKPEARLHTI